MNNPPSSKPPLAETLCFNAYALDRLVGRFYQAAFGDSGFTYPKYLILLALRESGPMSIGELSKKIGVENNSLSPLLKKMAAHDIVRRQRSSEDERQVLIEITELGSKVVGIAADGMSRFFSQMDIPKEDIERSISTLRAIRCRLESETPEPLNFPEVKPKA